MVANAQVYQHPKFGKPVVKDTSMKNKIDSTLSEALSGLKPHKKVNPNPPKEQKQEKPVKHKLRKKTIRIKFN
jgi:hypothetical protein